MFLLSVVDSSCLCYQFAFLLLVFIHKSIYWQNIEFLSFPSRMLQKTSHLLNLHMEHSFLISLFGCQKLSFIINTSVYKLGVIVFRRIIWNSSSTHAPFCVWVWTVGLMLTVRYTVMQSLLGHLKADKILSCLGGINVHHVHTLGAIKVFCLEIIVNWGLLCEN